MIFFCRRKVVECVEHYHVVGVVIVVSRLLLIIFLCVRLKIEDLFAYLVRFVFWLVRMVIFLFRSPIRYDMCLYVWFTYYNFCLNGNDWLFSTNYIYGSMRLLISADDAFFFLVRADSVTFGSIDFDAKIAATVTSWSRRIIIRFLWNYWHGYSRV